MPEQKRTEYAAASRDVPLEQAEVIIVWNAITEIKPESSRIMTIPNQ